MSKNTVPASSSVLKWAASRACFDHFEMQAHFPKWSQWVTDESKPTLKQLEKIAKFTHTPVGYFFLPQPPTIGLPISDFRTLKDEVLKEPSTELLDMVYLCEQRQDWYREYVRMNGFTPLDFVASASISSKVENIANDIRQRLSLAVDQRRSLPSWKEALSQMIEKAEELGVLVMASSIVGSNTHRKLLVDEFRGFVLVDEYAPLVFLNSSDSKAAQMFTLAHELAHVWLGESGVLDSGPDQFSSKQVEKWCNQVAAELLVPAEDLMREFKEAESSLLDSLPKLAKYFKVSSLVILRRLLDLHVINEGLFWHVYRQELQKIKKVSGDGGGDFYRTLGVRTGKRFTRAILSSALEGQTLFHEASRLLGVKKSKTFYESARKFGVLQ
jgi:Zn-dependent peptidase ImmA (M78 family)